MLKCRRGIKTGWFLKHFTVLLELSMCKLLSLLCLLLKLLLELIGYSELNAKKGSWNIDYWTMHLLTVVLLNRSLSIFLLVFFLSNMTNM